MNLLLGITVYDVTYSVGKRRMLFELDALVLRAIFDGKDTVETLEAIFQVPRTMLMEVLLRLFDDAWIVVPSRTTDSEDEPQQFLASRRAIEWIHSGDKDLPRPSTFELYTRTVARDLFTGRLASRRSIPALRSAEDVKETDGLYLPCQFLGTALDESSVPHHVPVPHGRFFDGVRQIRRRHQPLYLVATFDPESGRITGLPRIWERRLTERIRAHLAESGLWTATAPSELAAGERDLHWESTPESRLVSHRLSSSMFAYIADRLSRSNRRTRFAIILQEVTAQFLMRLESAITAAVEGGATVDLICGHAAEGVQDWMRRFSSDDGSGLNWNQYTAPVESDCFIEVTHDPVLMRGEGRVVLGSRMWLMRTIEGRDAEPFLAFELSNLRVVVEVCRRLAAFLDVVPGENTEKPPPGAWRSLATELSLIDPDQEGDEISTSVVRLALLCDYADRSAALLSFACARVEGRNWYFDSLGPGESHVLERVLELVGGDQPPVRIVENKKSDELNSRYLRFETGEAPDGLAIAGDLTLLLGLGIFVGDALADESSFHLGLAIDSRGALKRFGAPLALPTPG